MALDEEELAEVLETPLADTSMSLRTVNTMEEQGVLYVKQLLQCCGQPMKTCDECPSFVDGKRECGRQLKLVDIRNFGEKTLTEVFNVLEALGLRRDPDHPSLKKKRKKRCGRKY